MIKTDGIFIEGYDMRSSFQMRIHVHVDNESKLTH